MIVRVRKVRADLLTNPARSLLAVASLAVGIFAVGAMQLAGADIRDSLDRSYRAINPPSAVLAVEPFGPDLVDAALARREVGAAEGRRRLQVRAADPNGRPVSIELVAMVDFAANKVGRIVPEAGTWPPVDGSIVVERASLDDLGVAIGDNVTVEIPGRSPVGLRVAGRVHDMYEIAPSLGGPVRGYVSMATMEDLTGSDHLDTLFLRAADAPLDRDHALAVAALVRDEVITPAGLAVLGSEIGDPGEHRAARGMTFMVPTMQLLSAFALAIALVLIINTVTALMAHQRRQLGVMKAVGAISAQLTLLYLGFVLALSAAALVVAAPLSLAAGRALAGWTAKFANFGLNPLGVPWSVLGLEAVIALVVPVAAVAWTVRRACRMSVRDTLVDYGIAGPARGRRMVFPVSRPTRLALRNALRNRSRLVFTVATIALAGGALVGVLSTQGSLGRLTDQVSGYWSYDVELALIEPVEFADAASTVTSDPGVADVEGWFRTQAFRIRPDGTENEGIFVIGVPPESDLLAPTVTGGRWLEASDEPAVVVNEDFAVEEPDIGVGDAIVLDVEGNRRSWSIVGTVTSQLTGPIAYVPVAALTDTLGRPGRANLLAVQLEPGADQQQAADRLDAAARRAGIPVGEVQTYEERRAFVSGLFALVVGFLLGVGAILAVVALVSVAGTLTLSVLEQTREIGVLRAIGASRRAVRRILLAQGLTISAIGWLVGTILAIPAAILLERAIGEGLLLAPLPISFSWVGAVIWSAAALAIGALGATRPARVASRLTIRDTLSYE